MNKVFKVQLPHVLISIGSFIFGILPFVLHKIIIPTVDYPNATIISVAYCFV